MLLLEVGLIFINVITPVFALVLIGYVAGPRLGLEARTLSRYAYFLLVPSFVFNVMSTAEVEVALASRMIAYIIIVHLGCAGLGLLVGWLLKRPSKMIAAYVLVAVFGNVGNFGLPIIEFQLGPEAIFAATLYFLVIIIVAFIIGVAVASWSSGGSSGALWAVFKTPALIVLPPALLLNWAQIDPPLFLSRIVTLLGAAMVPTMLVALGVQLASAGPLTITRDTVTASALRLIGGPALALVLVIPFGLTGIERGTGIFQASMPAAVLTSIIAIEHDLLPEFVTTTVLFSTLVSVITLTILLSVV